MNTCPPNLPFLDLVEDYLINLAAILAVMLVIGIICVLHMLSGEKK